MRIFNFSLITFDVDETEMAIILTHKTMIIAIEFSSAIKTKK
jgi:hypothetical protein